MNLGKKILTGNLKQTVWMPRDISPSQFAKIKTILSSNNSRCMKKSTIPNAAAAIVEWSNISRFLEINLAVKIKHN